jgi:hypothetical protein
MYEDLITYDPVGSDWTLHGRVNVGCKDYVRGDERSGDGRIHLLFFYGRNLVSSFFTDENLFRFI